MSTKHLVYIKAKKAECWRKGIRGNLLILSKKKKITEAVIVNGCTAYLSSNRDARWGKHGSGETSCPCYRPEAHIECQCCFQKIALGRDVLTLLFTKGNYCTLRPMKWRFQMSAMLLPWVVLDGVYER